MAQLDEKIRQLLRKNIEYQWMPVHEKELEDLKMALTTAPVLKIYDGNEHCVIQCDASKSGIGFCLKEKKPYGSKSLTDAQINYGQIEKICLVVLMAFKISLLISPLNKIPSVPTKNKNETVQI